MSSSRFNFKRQRRLRRRRLCRRRLCRRRLCRRRLCRRRLCLYQQDYKLFFPAVQCAFLFFSRLPV